MPNVSLRQLGDLLAREVLGWIQEIRERCETSVALNFVGHSMGGVTARVALPTILEGVATLAPGPAVKYGQFLSLNTPHLGVNGRNVAGLFGGLAHTMFKKSWISEMGLSDGGIDTPCLLEEICDPTGPAFQALEAFEHRTAVAATHWDLMVPFSTGAICAANPFEPPKVTASAFWRFEAACGFAEDSPVLQTCRLQAEGRLENQCLPELDKCMLPVLAATARVRTRSALVGDESKELQCSGTTTSQPSSAGFATDEGTTVGKNCSNAGAPTYKRRRQQPTQGWISSRSDSLRRSVNYPKSMLANLGSELSWRRVAFTLHMPVVGDVHTFPIGKGFGVAWASSFVDVLIDTIEHDLKLN